MNLVEFMNNRGSAGRFECVARWASCPRVWFLIFLPALRDWFPSSLPSQSVVKAGVAIVALAVTEEVVPNLPRVAFQAAALALALLLVAAGALEEVMLLLDARLMMLPLVQAIFRLLRLPLPWLARSLWEWPLAGCHLALPPCLDVDLRATAPRTSPRSCPAVPRMRRSNSLVLRALLPSSLRPMLVILRRKSFLRAYATLMSLVCGGGAMRGDDGGRVVRAA